MSNQHSSGPISRRGPPSGTVLARLNRPQTAEATRFAVVADPHIATQAEGTAKLYEHTETHLLSAFEDIAGRNADAVLCVGDLTKDGEPRNFDAFDALLDTISVPFYAVPGNHDVPKESDAEANLSLSAFEDTYTPGSLPFHERVGGVSVIGLNSAGSSTRLTETGSGELTRESLDWLDETLADPEPRVDPASTVVLTHHNLPAMMDQIRSHRDAVEPEMDFPGGLRNGDELVELLSDHGVRLLLTGHFHIPSAARQGDLREIMAPTTCSFPQAYLLVDVGPDGTTVRFVPVTEYEQSRDAYATRRSMVPISRGLTGMASIRLANFPLVEE